MEQAAGVALPRPTAFLGTPWWSRVYFFGSKAIDTEFMQ